MTRPMSASKPRRVRHTAPKPPVVKAKSKLGPVNADEVELVRITGTKKKGGGPGGEAWIIMVGGKKAGNAYINMLYDVVRGCHPSFHIFLNRPSQGRQIGRIVYNRCCVISQYGIIYAHMRKSNIASRKAAEYAGFINATLSSDMQFVMAWHK